MPEWGTTVKFAEQMADAAAVSTTEPSHSGSMLAVSSSMPEERTIITGDRTDPLGLSHAWIYAWIYGPPDLDGSIENLRPNRGTRGSSRRLCTSLEHALLRGSRLRYHETGSAGTTSGRSVTRACPCHSDLA